MTSCIIKIRRKGGPGSGNWGHSGRPGMVGGSQPSKGSAHSWGAITKPTRKYTYAKNREEWVKKAEANEPAPNEVYRWANLREIHNLFMGKRLQSLDTSEDPEFYFAPRTTVPDNFLDRTYGRFVLDGKKLQEAGYQRDKGLFGEMAWRHKTKHPGDYRAQDLEEKGLTEIFLDSIQSFQIISNPKKYPLDDMQDWLDYRLGRKVPIIKQPGYSEDDF